MNDVNKCKRSFKQKRKRKHDSMSLIIGVQKVIETTKRRTHAILYYIIIYIKHDRNDSNNDELTQ